MYMDTLNVERPTYSWQFSPDVETAKYQLLTSRSASAIDQMIRWKLHVYHDVSLAERQASLQRSRKQ